MSSKLMVLWATVIMLLMVLLLLIGFKNQDRNYMKVESNIKEITRKYIADKGLTPKISKSVVIYSKDLIDGEYILPEIINKYCIKSVVYSKGLFNDNYQIERKCDKEE